MLRLYIVNKPGPCVMTLSFVFERCLNVWIIICSLIITWQKKT